MNDILDASAYVDAFSIPYSFYCPACEEPREKLFETGDIIEDFYFECHCKVLLFVRLQEVDLEFISNRLK